MVLYILSVHSAFQLIRTETKYNITLKATLDVFTQNVKKCTYTFLSFFLGTNKQCYAFLDEHNMHIQITQLSGL